MLVAIASLVLLVGFGVSIGIEGLEILGVV